VLRAGISGKPRNLPAQFPDRDRTIGNLSPRYNRVVGPTNNVRSLSILTFAVSQVGDPSWLSCAQQAGGLVPGIHVLKAEQAQNTVKAGTSPAAMRDAPGSKLVAMHVKDCKTPDVAVERLIRII
jgi:hypothetical protein